MEKGSKIATIGLLILGCFLTGFGLYMRETANQEVYISPEVLPMANKITILGSIFVAGTSIALIASRLRFSRPYQGSIVMIFVGVVLSAIPMVQTYDFYGYEYSFTTFPFSFIAYPLIGLGFGIIIYSYFTNHLRVEVIQSKEDNKIISTAKVVWKENSVKPSTNSTEMKEDINEAS